MAAVQYTRAGTGTLYQSSALADFGMAEWWSGYVWGAGAVPVSPASLAQTWNDPGGTYLFLGAAPADPDGFAAQLAAWLPRFAPGGPPRFLWLENPGESAISWRATGWFAAGPDASGAWTTLGTNRFALGAYRLRVAGGTALTLDTTEPARALFAAGSASLLGPGIGVPSTGTGAIAFQGARIGAFGVQVAVPADGLAGLGVGLLWALRHSADPADPRLDTVAMPVLGTAAAAMSLSLSWDPLNPTTRGRTGLSFAAGSPGIAATLVTQRGWSTTLTPMVESAPL
ncbi:MAG: hypothetical protein HQL41_07690, partial [Alphaproteobacteria bacterium]|nr:hypothetical protein [Alphaproteobacteria bacterium]